MTKKEPEESMEEHLERCEECRSVKDLPYPAGREFGFPMTIAQAHKILERYEEGMDKLPIDPVYAPRIVKRSVMVGCIGNILGMAEEEFDWHLNHTDESKIAYLAENLLEAYDALAAIDHVRQARLS